MSKIKPNLDLVRGAGGGGKEGGGSGRAPVEAPDSLRSIQYADVLDLIAEGEIVGLIDGMKSIYLDDTPLQNADGSFNFSNVIWQQCTGTQTQTPMTGFNSSAAETPVGAEITSVNSVTRTLSNSSNTAVRVTLSVPSLSRQDTSNGDILPTDVTIAIDVQNNGGGFIASALRRIFLASFFNLTPTGATTALASDQFNVTVLWTRQSISAPQTCEFQLQYRQVGNLPWLVYTSHAFSGGSFASSGLAGFAGVGSSGVINSKTFNLTLPSALYEFRLVKTNGSLQQASSGFLGGANTLTGTAYGGSVSITQGELLQYTNTDVLSGKTSSKYQRAYRIELPQPGPWDIRVRRITADSSSVTLQNKTFWDSYTELIDAKLSYPNSALQGLRIDAKQFNRIPSRGFEAKGMLVKIPNNYNPLTRVYTGAWNGSFVTAWTDNPAWLFYDLIANARYGLGEFVSASLIDKWALYSIAQYCDEIVSDGFGGLEPRFTASLYLQSQAEAYQVIGNIASIFRGMAFWSEGSITASQDAPKDASALFNQANVIDGMFNYSGSSSRVRHTVCLVAWNDPDDAYRQKIEYVEDAAGVTRYGVVQTDVVAIGCTSRGQAHRMGKWLLYSEQKETETITFRAAMDAVYVAPGDVIKTHDTNRAGARFGGRLIAATLSQLTLDAPVILQAGQTYSIACVLPDASIETRAITNAAGTYSVVNVSPNLSQLPLVQAIWLINGSNVNLEQWRVISIAEEEGTQVSITALSYRAEKYAVVEQNLILQPLPTSLINIKPPSTPNNLRVTESLYPAGLGLVGVSALLSWDSSADATSYTVTYQQKTGSLVTIRDINSNSVEIKPLAEGSYTFTVASSNNALGRKSPVRTLVANILGKTTPPQTLVNLQLSPLGSIGLFTWVPASDLDVIVGGKVKFRFAPNTLTSWDMAADLAGEISGASSSASFPLQAGIYLAKFEDSTGNQSVNATSIITNAANIMALNFVANLQGNPSWLGAKVNAQYYPALNGLILSSADLWDNAELMDSAELMDFGDGVISAGSYSFGTLDLGVVKTSRVSALVNARGFDLLDLWDAAELMNSTQLMDGDIVGDVSAVIYMRTTNDNPNLSPVWSAWIAATLADISARGFEFELRLSSDTTFHNVLVEAASIEVDMADLTQTGNDLLTGTGVYIVTFATQFQIIPAIGITAQNLATGDYFTVSAKSTSGFSVRFFNSANVGISKTFDYIAKAY